MMLVCRTPIQLDCAAAESSSRPLNVVFILADDLGWSDTTLHGTTRLYRTPNIDRLAKRGMLFTRAYSASPLCSPTRSAILTGLSPARTGITTPNCHLPQVTLQATVGTTGPKTKHAIGPNSVSRLNTTYHTLPESFREAGYATGHFGKWHLGPEPFSPLEQGFDVDLPHHAGPGPAGSFVAPWKFNDFDHDPDVPDQHIEDRMAIEAVDFMKQHRDEPFFLNYWMFSVHAPFDAKKSLIDDYRGRIDPNDAQRSPTYAAMIHSMDDAVGTLIDTLDELDLTDRTVVIFTSDNGGNMYDEVDETRPTSNQPLRGGKATMFEGGTRVPCVVAWPNVTEAGSQSETLVQSEDFYPTLASALSLPLAPEQSFDGVDIGPALRGESLDRGPVFQYFPHDPPVPDWIPASVSVHRDDWKLIRVFFAGDAGAHRYMLYDLANDIGETTNVAASHPELVTELDALIEDFLVRTEAIQPVRNPNFDSSQYDPSTEGVQPRKKQAKRPAPDAKTQAGWLTSQFVELTRDGSVIDIRSTGGDPWIALRSLPREIDGPVEALFSIRSDVSSVGSVFYSETPNQAFQKNLSVDFKIVGDGEFQAVTVALPVQSLVALRVDLGTVPATITIKELRVRSASGKITPVSP